MRVLVIKDFNYIFRGQNSIARLPQMHCLVRRATVYWNISCSTLRVSVNCSSFENRPRLGFWPNLSFDSSARSRRNQTQLCVRKSSAISGDISVFDAVYERLVKEKSLVSGLYITGTPIGNLDDVSIRVLRVLSGVSAIFAEDTRNTRKLLEHFGIRTPLVSYHEHNERARESLVLSRLRRGEALALVSDAGMPGICDPGAAIASAAAAEGLRVVPIPGPSAMLLGLVGSGLPTSEILFVGFLPPKPAARRQRLGDLAGSEATLVLYVPPHSLTQTLQDAASVFGEGRKCCVARELTKIHEEFWRGTLSGALAEFTERAPRGEITLLIAGSDGAPPADEASAPSAEDRVQELMLAGETVSSASKQVAKEFPSFGRRRAYNVALRLQKRDGWREEG